MLPIDSSGKVEASRVGKWVGSVAATILGMGVIAVAGTACVDTEPALKLKGFTAYPATVEQQTLTCNPDAEGMMGGPETYEVTYETASCDTEVDPADIETFQYEAGLNINQFASVGQPGFGTTGTVTSLRGEVCQDTEPPASDLVSATEEWFRENSGSANFTIAVNVINNLEDNRNTGAQGGGGGGQGGGFEGLYSDGNDVKLQTVEIRFPGLGSRFDRDIQVAAVADSQGGAVNIPAVRVFSSNQVSQLQDLHRDLVVERTSVTVDQYNNQQAPKEAEVVVEAEVRIQGETLSGKNVTSNALNLPIRLCRSGTACTTTGACGYTL